MRFGKRPAGGHSLIHFGKREGSKPQHSFLYFGKRTDDQDSIPDILQYLQKNRDNSYKRGHTIMRFGKRATGSHNFIRFGRGDADEDYDGFYSPNEQVNDEDQKRAGHNMMYFGKRGGHSMMYFGKRIGGHAMLSFGKRDDDKRAHSMIHFGKREDQDDDDLPLEDKRAHSMIHFGKREGDDIDDDSYPDELKRASHSMIHFGKREFDEGSLPYWDPNTIETKQHNLLRFGKKMDGFRKGSHAMIHFGKRDEDKRAHSMIHFGKRSVDQDVDSAPNNQSGNFAAQPLTRMKRDIEEPIASARPLVALIPFENNEDEDTLPDEDLESAIKASQANMYRDGEIMDPMSYPEDEQIGMPYYPDYRPIQKKEASKNVFLRFG